MIKRQLNGGKPPKTILAGVAVASQNALAIKLDRLARNPGEAKHTDDPGNGQTETHRADPVVVAITVGFVLLTEVGPVIEVEREVVPVLDVNNLSHRSEAIVALEKKGERSTHRNHAKRGVVRIQQQHVAA